MSHRLIAGFAAVAAVAACAAVGAAAAPPAWGPLGAPDVRTNTTIVRPTLVRSTVCDGFASGELVFTGPVHLAYLDWYSDKAGNPFVPGASLWLGQGHSDVRGVATGPSGFTYELRGSFDLPRSLWNTTHTPWGWGSATIVRSDGARVTSPDSVYFFDAAHSDAMFAIRLGTVGCTRR